MCRRLPGANSGFPDKDYVAAGAELLPTIEEVYAKAEMIIKVKEPIEPEYKLIRQGQLVFTYFHFASREPHDPGNGSKVVRSAALTKPSKHPTVRCLC